VAWPAPAGSLTFLQKGRELQPAGRHLIADRQDHLVPRNGSRVFDSDGLVTAQQEPNESKDRQEKGWHMLRLFVPNPLQVNLLREDAIMANDSLRPAEFNPMLKRIVAEHCPSERIRATGKRGGTRRRSRGP